MEADRSVRSAPGYFAMIITGTRDAKSDISSIIGRWSVALVAGRESVRRNNKNARFSDFVNTVSMPWRLQDVVTRGALICRCFEGWHSWYIRVIGFLWCYLVRTVGADRHTSWHTYLPQTFLVGISKLAISGARDLKKKTRKDISYQTARNVV